MRLDKFLKVSRIIKRRTVANEACDNSYVTVNGAPAKASRILKIGDVVEVAFGNRTLKFKVLSLAEHVSKNDASAMYEVLT
ncbi:MAG: RNA-binding S4 domain-containing protein [Ruminococcaceae bacterium]|nr:RNA-binding S4 domain-containing protein [Oscillospiraceae bacterium]